MPAPVQVRPTACPWSTFAAILSGYNFEEIVVMTFTRKATAEIRERIFQHIEESSKGWRGQPGTAEFKGYLSRPGSGPGQAGVHIPVDVDK